MRDVRRRPDPLVIRSVVTVRDRISALPAIGTGRWRPGGQGIVATGSDSGDGWGGQPDDLAHALERIAAPHSSGALTDEEFAAATSRLLHVDHTAVDEIGEFDHGAEGR